MTDIVARVKFYKSPFLALFILNCLDTVTTIIGINRGGVELNPLAAYLGIYPFLILKLFVPLIIMAELAVRPKVNAKKTLWLGAVIIGAVLLNNIAHLVILYNFG